MQDWDTLKKELLACRNALDISNKKSQADQHKLDDLNKQLQSAQAAHNQKGAANLQTKITATQQEVNMLLSYITDLTGQISDLETNLIPQNQQKVAQEQADLNRLQDILQHDQNALNNLRHAGHMGQQGTASSAAAPTDAKSAAKQGSAAAASTTTNSASGQKGAVPGPGLPVD